MLVLTRHIDESIILGDDILVTVKEIQDRENGTATLAIQAPPETTVLTTNLYQSWARKRREIAQLFGGIQNAYQESSLSEAVREQLATKRTEVSEILAQSKNIHPLQRDEAIVIGDDTVITIVDIRLDKTTRTKSHKVRMGINCPVEVPVHRKEVYEAIQRENRQAEEKGNEA